MKVLVTGSAGHLREALVRHLDQIGMNPIGLDIKPSDFTKHEGSIIESEFVDACTWGMHAVIHAATLHKPHVGTHSRQAFIDTNESGTLKLRG